MIFQLFQSICLITILVKSDQMVHWQPTEDWLIRTVAVWLIACLVPVTALGQGLVLRYKFGSTSVVNRPVETTFWLDISQAVIWLTVTGAIVFSLRWGDVVCGSWQMYRWPWFAEICLIAPHLFSLVLSWLVLGWMLSGGGDRWSYLGLRFRSLLLMVLFPLAIIGFGGWLQGQFAIEDFSIASFVVTALLLVAALITFPYFVRLAWPSAPIKADSELARELRGCGLPLKLEIDQFRIWKTGEQLINAVVVGFIPKTRTIYLTDSVVQHFPEGELSAIVRHEIGHLVKNHMSWRLYFLCLPVILIGTWVEFSKQYCWVVLLPGFQVFEFSAVTLALLMGLIGWAVWGNHRLSHLMEHEADYYAAFDEQQGKSPADQLENTIGCLSRLAIFLPMYWTRGTYSHPSLSSRIAFLENIRARPELSENFRARLRKLKLHYGLILVLIGSLGLLVR